MKRSRIVRMKATGVLAILACLGAAQRAYGQNDSPAAVTNVCHPVRTAVEIVATAAQRQKAGAKTEPPMIVGPTGFDWSDTQLGVVKSSDGKNFLYFGSDGSCHANCGDPTERDGSITRTVGGLSNPLGDSAPVEAILPQSAQFKENSVVYVGGGPVYRVPAGHPGAGNLLMVYGAARLTDLKTQSGNYGFTGLAKSTDDGFTWTDLDSLLRPINDLSRAPVRPQMSLTADLEGLFRTLQARIFTITFRISLRRAEDCSEAISLFSRSRACRWTSFFRLHVMEQSCRASRNIIKGSGISRDSAAFPPAF